MISLNSPAHGHAPSYSDAPVLIHVGLHKTATTWFQNQILSPKNGSEICYSQNFNLTHRAFITPTLEEFSTGAALSYFGTLTEIAGKTSKPIVLSDEALGGFPFNHKYYREINALRMKATFPNAKILVTIREQDKIIHSMYGEYLRYGYSSKLTEFLFRPDESLNFHSIFDYSAYDYNKLYDLYAGIFGTENIHFWPMEWMTKNSAAVVEKLGEILEQPLSPPCKEKSNQIQRPALNPVAQRFLRILNRFESHDSRWQRQPSGLLGKLRSTSVAHRVDHWTRNWDHSKTIREQKATIRKVIGDTYAQSNHEVTHKINFDLADLGYQSNPSS